MNDKQNIIVIRKTTPVLIIGAGAAGIRSGIEMKRNGTDPLIIGKRDHGDAHTTWARGGINAALGNLDTEDSWRIHAADTLDEGHYINDAKAVENMAKNIPDVITELHDWGMDFTLTEDGKINQRYFGAQSFRRTCFAGDYTGEALLDTLVKKAKNMDIDYDDNIYISKILSDGNEVYGAYGYDFDEDQKVVFRSNRVVLAAGGYTAIYNTHSSRDDENTADGIGLALDAGAEIMDVEFVQFHPTGMSGERYGEEWDGRLVTEAVRGEGGRLFNSEGERFMDKYSPDQMELDARDVVARAIDTEIREGRGTGNNAVYLDISHKNKEFIKERLPRMYERFKSIGVDISNEPMEVSPTAHYGMGGVKMDPDTAETSVSNLHVLGESSVGVHGANRLGGNSLAETVSIGKLAGEYIGRNTRNKVNRDIDISEYIDGKLENIIQKKNNSENPDGNNSDEVINKIRNIMDEYAGIRRSENKLKTGLSRINDIEKINNYNICSDNDIEKRLNIMWMIDTAKILFKFAIKRNESRGSHYRVDNQERNEDMRINYVYNCSNENVTFQKPAKPSEEVQDAIDKNYELDYHHLE